MGWIKKQPDDGKDGIEYRPDCLAVGGEAGKTLRNALSLKEAAA
ncbi:MAG: hypothetical protein WBZ19_01375 [Chthoniobacterales bacterium]